MFYLLGGVRGGRECAADAGVPALLPRGVHHPLAAEEHHLSSVQSRRQEQPQGLVTLLKR